VQVQSFGDGLNAIKYIGRYVSRTAGHCWTTSDTKSWNENPSASQR
jgi:hypothetical protein